MREADRRIYFARQRSVARKLSGEVLSLIALKNLHICPVASQTAFKQIKQIYKRSDKKTTDPLFPFFEVVRF